MKIKNNFLSKVSTSFKILIKYSQLVQITSSVNMTNIKTYVLKIVFFLSFFCSLTYIAKSQEYTPLNEYELKSILNYPYRNIISLSGKWEQSYDGETWEIVNLPNSLNTKSKVIYRKTIKIQDKPATDYVWQLYFLGLDDEAEIYFNEHPLGKQTSMMVPFTIIIPTNFINNDVNTLKIIVKQAKYTAKKIREQNIYTKKIYTGVLRDIYLVKTPLVWINDCKIKTKLTNNFQNAYIDIKFRISSSDIDRFLKILKEKDSTKFDYSSNKNFSIEAQLFYDRDSNRLIAKSSPIQFSLGNEMTVANNLNLSIANPRLWNPNSFNSDSIELYRLSLKLFIGTKVIDEISTNIGFKYISISKINNKPLFFINGNVTELKGVDYIEDFANYNQTLTPKRMEEDIKLIKMLGVNAIRFKYSTPHPYLAALCDRYGILMLIDLQIYDVPSKLLNLEEVRNRISNYQLQITSFYDRYVSLFAWGISEGIEESTEEYNNFSKFITNAFRANSDKLLYKIILLGSKKIDAQDYDFIGIRNNIRSNSLTNSSTNYQNIINELLRLQTLISDKPLFYNYGIPIQPDNENGFDDPLSVDAQEYFIERIYDFLKNNGFAGSLIYSFNDYILNHPLMILNNPDIYLCSSGLIDRTRVQKRKAYDKLLQLFKNIEDRKTIDRKKYIEQVPILYIIVGILLCLIIVFLINRFRRFREYLYRSVFRPYNFYADIRDQRILSSFQSYIIGAVISVNLALYFSSILFFYRTNELAQYILMLFFPCSIQEFLYKLVWNPQLSILLFSVFFYLIVFLVASIIKLFSLLIKSKIYFSDTYTITIWSGTPYIALLPISIVLLRLMVAFPILSWVAIFLFIFVTIWVILRILRSVAIVFDIPFIRSFIFGIGFITITIAIITLIYQSNSEIIPYLDYFFNVMFIL